MIDRICGQGHQKTILEHFKSHFAKAAAVSYYPSSNESWASSDLDTVMSEAAVNAPLFIEAFYDACEAIKSRYPEMEMPGARRINRILSDEDTGFQIDPPNLITTREYVPIAVPAQAPSLDAQAVEEVIETGREWDVFICHASEDKDDFVRPLAGGLEQRGLRVWFDESTLRVGDSLRESIDHGLNRSRFGIVVLSPHFFSKQWPQNELNGLATREAGGLKVILPRLAQHYARESPGGLANLGGPCGHFPRARVWTVSSRSSCRRSLHPS